MWLTTAAIRTIAFESPHRPRGDARPDRAPESARAGLRLYKQWAWPEPYLAS